MIGGHRAPCDEAVIRCTAAAAAAAPSPAHARGTLAATILGSSMAFIDGSVVNVALPAIRAQTLGRHRPASSGSSTPTCCCSAR